jgi:hypothetical protein
MIAPPLGGLVFLFVVGVGPSAVLAPRLPEDAQAALAPVVGAALVACASVLLPFGVPARPLAVAVAVAGVAVGVAARRRAGRALRAAVVPLAVGLAAMLLVALPGLVRGDWHAATLYGSTDAYHWSSQARAYLDGPAPAPVDEHPDRLTYERSKSQHWAVALPFGLLQLAWLSRADPPAVYGAFAALLAALLPLAAFAVARGWLEWRPAVAAGAALALAANAALLFASYFSWQQQVAGVAFAFSAAAALRLWLEPAAAAGELFLAALLTAAALATYRLGFAPYLLVLLVAVVVAYAAARRRRRDELVGIGRALALFGVAAALLAAPSLAALGSGLPDFVSSGGFSTAFKRAFPAGQLGEALGLVPHVWSVQEDWPAAARLGWLLIAWAAAVLVLVAGARALSRRAPRADFLAAGAALTLGGYGVLLLPVFAPYLSFKILSYGAPFLVLLALVPLARGRGWLALAAGLLVVPAAAVAVALADDRSHRPAAADLDVAAIPPDAVVSVAVDDPWEQAWTIYYLRDHRLSVERPSYLLTEQGASRDPAAYRHRPVDFVVRERAGRLTLERAGAG